VLGKKAYVPFKCLAFFISFKSRLNLFNSRHWRTFQWSNAVLLWYYLWSLLDVSIF